ncbi:MAG: endo-1,4-beta-xylanase, partial [Spirochaetales bacterium]|nr:endo-1,4-beta-xylanase [Spirochaetales bacterium]
VTNATKGTFTAVSGSQYTIQITGPTQGAGVQVTLSGAGVTDNAGNAYAGGDGWIRTYDSIAPTLSSFSPASGGHFITAPYTLTINFSETVVGFSAAKITVTNATKGTFTAVSGSQYAIQLANPTDRSNVQVTLSGTGVTDNAGNAYAGGAGWSKIYRSKFIGCVIADSVPATWNTYWDQVTSENGGKWGSVEDTRDTMNYGSLNVAYNHSVNNGFDFKEHCLVWGSQYPSWITSLSAADQRAEVEEWIADYFSTHPDTALVDVVNEPIKTSCPFAAALGGAGGTGYDWVVWSFQKAKIYAGGAKCLINEYGTENDPPVRTTYKNIINILKGYGVIDGIGIQCHSFNLDYMTAGQMQTCLDDLGGLGLPIYVSELDIKGQSGTNNDTTQRAQYQALFPVIYGHSAVKGITFWGYEYGVIWQTNAELLNSSGAERPAMIWLRQQNYVGGN